MTLAITVGALLFYNYTDACAEETAASSEPVKQRESLFDDYRRPVGLTYNAQARIQTTYLWRGLYAGGANIQASANVGYGGLYLDMWWNIGVTDWTFLTFQPEVDISLGFNRWGLDIFLLYIHNFNCGFFDFGNYLDKGNRLEVDVRYTLSSKIPLTFAWASRVAASDAYPDAAGNPVRAWSSYAEISYTQRLPYGLSLYGAVGCTPWRSVYTGYKGGFAVNNVELRLRKDWSASDHCGLMLQGQLTINPSVLAADKTTAEWHPYNPGNQTVNANLTFGVYLK